MPELFGARYTRAELNRRIGRLEQVAGVRLVTIGDGLGRGVRVLEFRTGTGFAFDVLVDRELRRRAVRTRRAAAQLAVGRRGRRALVLRARRLGLVPCLGRRHGRHLRAGSHPGAGRGHGGALQPAAHPHDGPVRPARPRGRPARSPGRVRGALGRRRVRAVGGGRGAAVGGLRRAARAPPAHRGEGRRVLFHAPRPGREHRAHPGVAHVPLSLQRRVPGRGRVVGAPRPEPRR